MGRVNNSATRCEEPGGKDEIRTRWKEEWVGEESLGRRLGDRAQGLREGSPEISEALARGSFVSVSARLGNDVSGYVCDHDVSGLLLDVRDPSGDPGGYEFLPWSSIERLRVYGSKP